MAGGIFTPSKFHPNIKCVIISFFLAISYWLAPARNLLVLVLILIISYIGLSWYDYLYECNLHMTSGSSGFAWTSLFKPQNPSTVPNSELLPLEQQQITYLKTVYMFHLFLVAPLMLYTSYHGYKHLNTNPHLYGSSFAALGVIGGLAGVYHGSRLFFPRQTPV